MHVINYPIIHIETGQRNEHAPVCGNQNVNNCHNIHQSDSDPGGHTLIVMHNETSVLIKIIYSPMRRYFSKRNANKYINIP